MKKIVFNGVDVRLSALMHVNLTDLQKAADVADDESLRPALWLLARDGAAIVDGETKKSGIPAATCKGDDWYVAVGVACAYLRHVGSNIGCILRAKIMETKAHSRAEARTENEPSRNSSPAPESTAVSPFNFEGKDVRVIDRDGDPWFVASDVCKVLAIEKVDSALRGLDADEKGTHTVSTLGGAQRVSVISEPGLYALLAKSRKPEAKRFDRWVRHEVLPSIRKTGRYEAPRQESPNRGGALANALEGIGGALVELKGDIDAVRDESRESIKGLREEIRQSAANAPTVTRLPRRADYDTMTHLLQVNGIGLDPVAFRRALVHVGLIESCDRVVRPRAPGGRTQKSYWVFTARGMQFGCDWPLNSHETQLLFEKEKFMLLYKKLRRAFEELGVTFMWHECDNGAKAMEYQRNNKPVQGDMFPSE